MQSAIYISCFRICTFATKTSVLSNNKYTKKKIKIIQNIQQK